MMLSTTEAAAAPAAAPSPPDSTTSSSHIPDGDDSPSSKQQKTTRRIVDDAVVVVDGENDTTVEETGLRKGAVAVAPATTAKDDGNIKGAGGDYGINHPAACLSSSVTPAEDEEEQEQEASCEEAGKGDISGEEEAAASSGEASRLLSSSQQGSCRKRGRQPGEEVIDEQGDDEDDMSDSLSGRGHYPDPAASLSAAAVASISSAAYPPQQHHQQSHVHMLHGHVHVGLSGSSSAVAAQHHHHRGSSSSAADNTTEGEPSVSTGLSSDPCTSMPTAQQPHLDLTHFYEAMSLMNPTERRGWDEAQSRCSAAVLENECCPCYFLRANQHNPWDAAAMACAYWNERITLFRDRAFDPLTMGGCSTEVHGNGMDDTAGTSTATASSEPTGLAREDVDILETGCMQLLPPDADGRSVLYLDRSLLEPHMLRQTVPRLRVLWYLFQKAYTSDGPIPHRVVVIGLVCRPPNGGYDFSFPARGMRIAAALPIQIETYHLLTLPAVSGTGRVLKTVLAVCAGMLGMYFQSQTKVHHGAAAATATAAAAATSASAEGEEDPHEPDPKDAESGASSSPTPDPRLQLLEKLQTYGLSKKGLPECAGGTFTLESFRNWLKRQRRIEQHNTWTGEQRSQRRREINRIHSRQKRQRRRQEFYELQDQAKALELDNDRARRVNAHLEALLYTARGMVHSSLATASHGGVSGAAAYSPMNTLSSGDASSVPPIHAPQSQRVPSHTHNPQSLHNQLQHQHDYSQMLAALEPDPIAPYHIPKTAVAAQEWGPDPIAPSCDPKASASHHQGNHSATGDDLKRLSRALNSWHGVHSATPPETDGLASAADSAAVYADSVQSHATGLASSSFSHGLQAGLHHRSSGVANSGYSASQVASASTSTYLAANESSSSTVKLPTPTSTLQALFPFFYKTPTVDPAPVLHQQEEHRAPLAAPVPSAAAAAASSDVGGPFGQYWTLYASGTSDDGPTSMSPAPAPNAHEDLDLSSDDPLHRLERWDDGNGGGLLSLLKTDDNDAFEPLDHRIAWDSFV